MAIDTEVRTCTREGCKNAATEKHQWCNPCKAKYQEEWRKLKVEMETAKAWAAGWRAAQMHLANAFGAMPAASILGYNAALFIVREKCPPMPKE